MSLTGDVNTLALSDLVQVSAMNRRTCQIHVIAPHAEGDLYLERGAPVHAWWGDLVGAEAVYAMLTTPDVGFHVRPDVTVAARTIAAGWQQLVLEAARRYDHGSVPQPRVRSSARWRSDASEPTPTPRRLPSSDYAQPMSIDDALSRAAGPPRLVWMLAVVLLAAALVAIVARTFRVASRPALARAVAARPMVFEAAQLTGPGDAAPTLVSGTPPVVPRGGWPVAPTIVCRLTIDSDGAVRDSRIYRSRLELVPLEEAALTAVERYRFRPARHAGMPVAAVINWPVAFVAADGRPARTLTLKGSDTIGGALAPALARAFHARRPDLDVAIEALGTRTAFVGLFDGSADVGAASRSVSAGELAEASRLGVTLREFVFAYDGIAVIVHPDNPLHSLSLADLGRIYAGQWRRWSDVGGADAPIRVLDRPSYSGTHAFFRERVLGKQPMRTDVDIVEDNHALVDAVARDRNAIAYVGSGWLGPGVRALALSPASGQRAILPGTAAIRDGSYPIYRPLLFYTRGAPTRDAADWLSFVLGPEGQAIVRDRGFVALDAPAAPIEAGAAGSAVEPVRIHFAAGGARLSDDARAALVVLARRAGRAHLLVVGHADAEGDPATNHRLALARAQHVARYVSAVGVDAARVDVQADDADAPLASNQTVSGRRQNRRVDVFVLRR